MSLNFLPQLTGYDPETASEGSIDPLGLYLISERLSTALVPGMRERMRHPRYLTAMAVGHVICQAFDEDQVAKDKQTPPWLVYEWLVVQAFIQMNREGSEVLGLPGSLKARKAKEQGQPISAANYLKNPGTFGFHGVYRTLANEVQLIGHHQLGENGARLVQVWEAEQGLTGFLNSNTGPGADFRRQIQAAIKSCLDKGTSEKWGWKGLAALNECLNPNRIGNEEADFLRQMLLEDNKGYRKEIIAFMDEKGLTLLQKDASERYLHEALLPAASVPLAKHLEAILAYERFSRIIQNLWEEVRYSLSTTKTKLHAKDLIDSEAAQKAAAELNGAWQDAADKLEAVQHHMVFVHQFSSFGQSLTAVEIIERLMEHHQKVQKAKLPFGKRPWVEDWSNGYFSVRPAYTRKTGSDNSEGYVNFYRSFSLQSFLQDLTAHVTVPVA